MVSMIHDPIMSEKLTKNLASLIPTQINDQIWANKFILVGSYLILLHVTLMATVYMITSSGSDSSRAVNFFSVYVASVYVVSLLQNTYMYPTVYVVDCWFG